VNGGAVAYLAHSVYGRNGNELSINNSFQGYTGRSSGVAGNSNTNRTGTGTYTYNTSKGMLASTTGNITGVYDMSGGAMEWVAAFNSIDERGYLETEGWSGLNTSRISTPYATKYTSESQYSEVNSSQCIIGDASYEVYRDSQEGWFDDICGTVERHLPFLYRGGNVLWGHEINIGIFSMASWTGEEDEDKTFRVCLPGI